MKVDPATLVKDVYVGLLEREPTGHEADAFDGNVAKLIGEILHSQEFRKQRGFIGFENRWVLTKVHNRSEIWCCLSDTRVSHGVILGNWEPDETAFLRNNLSPGDVFIDVGANIGWFTLLGAELVGASGEVFAFEPNESIRARLIDSTVRSAASASIKTLPYAADVRSRPAHLVSDNPRNPGHTWLEFGDSAGPSPGDASGPVECRRLDDVLSDALSRCDVIKLDVEGAEYLALRGAERILREFRPVVLCEIYPEMLRIVSGIYDELAIFDYLGGFGYQPYLLQNGGFLVPYRGQLVGSRYWTVVFKQPEPA